MRRFGSLLFTFACGFGTVVACSSADSKPGAATSFLEGGASSSSGGEGGSDLDAMSNADTLACTDKQKNNSETDVDCGGGVCPGCSYDHACGADSDCATGLTCTDGKKCASCNDSMRNGSETAPDCGGSSCISCGVGKGCLVDADCASLRCDTSKLQCGCPDGMTNVSLGGNNGAFCIDTAEVTQAQYAKFIAASYPTGAPYQSGYCLTANIGSTAYVPAHAWPPHTGPLDSSGMPIKAWNDGLPVHYVDWCDARAYCKWAGKSLCGTLDGKSLTPDQANDPTKSAWYNVCASGGNQKYPYGSTFVANNCNGTGLGESGPDTTIPVDVTSAHYGYAENEDTGVYEVAATSDSAVITGYTHITCQGGANGNIYQLSGDVAEWEDDCDGDTATSKCQLRGGSYAANNDQAALACTANRTSVKIPTDPNTLADVGIRCCEY